MDDPNIRQVKRAKRRLKKIQMEVIMKDRMLKVLVKTLLDRNEWIWIIHLFDTI